MAAAHYKAPRTTLGWGAILSVLFSMMILVSSMNPHSTGSHAPVGDKSSVGGSVTGFGFRSLLSEIVGTKAQDASFGVSYIVLIDAGSSGSRVHVFSLSRGEGPLPDLHLPSKKLKVEPGLSSFADRPSEAGQSLKELVDFVLQAVPEEARAATKFVIAGTAGLRLLSEKTAGKILASCEDYVRFRAPFQVKSRVISGTEEGVFGWISVNYLAGRLRGMRDEAKGTLTSLEVGGASFQITFRQKTAPATDHGLFQVKVGRDEYRLYTHSFLGLGQDEARDTYNSMLRAGKSDPCLQTGYAQREGEGVGDVYRGPPGGGFVGGGDYEGCREAIKRLVLEGGDRGGECWTPPCSIGSVHQPSFWGRDSDQVVAFEHFRHTASALSMVVDNGGEEGLSGSGGVHVGDYAEAGKRFCAEEWDPGMGGGDKYAGMRPGSRHKYCFSAVFLSVLLELGVGAPPRTPLHVIGRISGADIDWAAGMAIEMTSPHPPSASYDDEALWQSRRGVGILFLGAACATFAVGAYLLYRLVGRGGGLRRMLSLPKRSARRSDPGEAPGWAEVEDGGDDSPWSVGPQPGGGVVRSGSGDGVAEQGRYGNQRRATSPQRRKLSAMVPGDDNDEAVHAGAMGSASLLTPSTSMQSLIDD